MRAKIFFSRGNDVTVDCESIKLTPDTVVLYTKDAEDHLIVAGEFYRSQVAGWKRESE